MNRIVIPREDWEYDGDFNTVQLRCPECGRMRSLPHKIDSAGDVHPSVDCGVTDCSFHTYVTLAGWTHGERADEDG